MVIQQKSRQSGSKKHPYFSPLHLLNGQWLSWVAQRGTKTQTPNPSPNLFSSLQNSKCQPPAKWRVKGYRALIHACLLEPPPRETTDILDTASSLHAPPFRTITKRDTDKNSSCACAAGPGNADRYCSFHWSQFWKPTFHESVWQAGTEVPIQDPEIRFSSVFYCEEIYSSKRWLHCGYWLIN